MLAAQKILGMVKDVCRMAEAEEIPEESLQSAAAIMLNYDNIEIGALFSEEEKFCGISFLAFLKAVFRYYKDIKNKDFIGDAKGRSHNESSENEVSGEYETGPMTEEINDAIYKIKHAKIGHKDVATFYVGARNESS